MSENAGCVLVRCHGACARCPDRVRETARARWDGPGHGETVRSAGVLDGIEGREPASATALGVQEGAHADRLPDHVGPGTGVGDR
jgi:hypothetical protein